MSDDLIKRLLAEETDLTDCAADHIEQTETKLAKAMEYLRKIAAYTHIGTHEQGIVQNAEARIACTALAELEGEPLGAEFEAVWDDNKGELYEP